MEGRGRGITGQPSDKGSLLFESGQLSLTLNSQSTVAFNKQTSDMFGMPESHTRQIEINESVNQHAVVLSNFIQAILHDEPLIATAKDGLASMDIANAMLLSSWQNQSVTLPLNRQLYQQHLDAKIASSSLRKKSSRKANIDMSSSYR